jgi:hypothetical protein
MYCEKEQCNTINDTNHCIRFVAVKDNDNTKITYCRAYLEANQSRRQIEIDKIFIDTLKKKNVILNNKDFQSLLVLLNKTYNSLLKKGYEEQTLAAVSKFFNNRINKLLDVRRGVLLDDGSIVTFNDYSPEITSYIQTISREV